MRHVEQVKRSVNAYLDRRLGRVYEDLDRSRNEVAGLRESVLALREDVAALSRDVESLRQTAHLLTRRSRRPGPVRCLFLVHYMESWDALADVVAEMSESPDFEPIVASIPRRLPGSAGFTDEDLTHERLSRLGIRHLRLAAEDSTSSLEAVQLLDPDVIFRQSQWDADVPEGFATRQLRFARLCLVPYEPMNLVENVPWEPEVTDMATDSRFHRSCWMVFCANERVREQAARHSPSTGAAQFVVTGHPKVQRLQAELARNPSAPGSRPFTVLWSAHHSIDDGWTRFGHFPAMADGMVAWARERPDLRFVFSPHPSLVTRMEAAAPPLTVEQVRTFRESWAALPNTEAFLGGDTGTYGALFARTDALVTDGLSWLLEYQVVNRPVVFVERPGHRPFNELGDVAVSGAHVVADVAGAAAVVGRFADGEPDPLSQRQREVVDELFGSHDSAHEIVSAIRSRMAAETEPPTRLMS